MGIVTVKDVVAWELRNDYMKLSKQIGDLLIEQRKTLEHLQRTCKHEACAEVDYEPETTYSDSLPPRRICLVCGLEEEGWGSGYKELDKSDVTVHYGSNRDKVYNLRKLDFDLKQTLTVG